MRNQRHVPAALFPVKNPVPIEWMLGGGPESVWTVLEKRTSIASDWIRIPVRPARS